MEKYIPSKKHKVPKGVEFTREVKPDGTIQVVVIHKKDKDLSPKLEKDE